MGTGETMPRWLDYVPADELRPNPRNPKGHAEEELDASIARFDFTEPVMVDERTGLLVSGHGRREAVLRWRDAGKPPPEGVMVDEAGAWLLPVIRGWRSTDDNHAMAYLLAANRLTEKGGWSQDPLAEVLQEVAASSTLEGTGFTNDELAQLLAEVAPPAFDPVAPETQPRLDEVNPITCPHCGETFRPA